MIDLKIIKHKLKKEYDTCSTIIIPIILTFILEIIKKGYDFLINMKNNNNTSTLKDDYPDMKIIIFVLFVVINTVLILAILYINSKIKKILSEDTNEEEYMKDTFLRLKEFGYKRQECFKTNYLTKDSNKEYVEFLINSHKKSIDLVVSTCLEFFKNSFSAHSNLVNEISFEVSFMSKSISDENITIVSSDNNKHRTPPSMLKRSTDPNIYDNTETGKLYKRYDSNPSESLGIYIIEDCSTETEFTTLYEGQTDSIKSMAILPILSPKNELLGTLVVCVNKSNFFKNKESHFWNELLEIYSVELGYHYLALMYCINNNNLLQDSLKDIY